jgi:hypothetical protein
MPNHSESDIAERLLAIDIGLTRWLKFFTGVERLDPDTLPDWMQTPEMQQALSTLSAFFNDDRHYHAYRARVEYLRVQQSISRELEDARAAQAAAEREREAERQAKEAALQAQEAERQAIKAARQAKEEAQAEVARLKALLQGQETPR